MATRLMKNEKCSFKRIVPLASSQLVTHYLSMHKDADESLVEGAIAEAKELEKQLFPPKVPICETCGKCLRKR